MPVVWENDWGEEKLKIFVRKAHFQMSNYQIGYHLSPSQSHNGAKIYIASNFSGKTIGNV